MVSHCTFFSETFFHGSLFTSGTWHFILLCLFVCFLLFRQNRSWVAFYFIVLLSKRIYRISSMQCTYMEDLETSIVFFIYQSSKKKKFSSAIDSELFLVLLTLYITAWHEIYYNLFVIFTYVFVIARLLFCLCNCSIFA